MGKIKKKKLNKNSYPVPGNTRPRRDSKPQDYKISKEAKLQILGFFLILIAVLLLISIFTYSQRDYSAIHNIGIFDLLRSFIKKDPASVNINNWLGLSGAYVSNFLIRNTFGYFVVLFPAIIIFFGINLIRKKSLIPPVTFGTYALLLMVGLSSAAGILQILLPAYDYVLFSGGAGDFVARTLTYITGTIGACVIIVLWLSVIIFFMFDNNIIKTLARIKIFFEKFKEKFRHEKQALKDKETEKLKQKPVEEVKEKESIDEELEHERDKIKKAKFTKPVEEEPVIKETEINRPAPVPVPAEEENADGKTLGEITEELLDIKKEIESEKETENTDKGEIITNTPLKNKIKQNKEPVEEEEILDEEIEEEEEEEVDEKLEDYKKPVLDILINPTFEESEVIPDDELTLNGKLLQEKLLKFGIEIEKVMATPGPVVTLYELIPAPDVKLSKIESLQDDIALAMKAKGIRMIIPIPGKGTVGVEIPNSKAQIVRIKEILMSKRYNDSKCILPIAFGKMIDGEIYVDDLAKMPHILIAGSTGSGKSVGINSIIASLVYKLDPADLKFVIIDPKKIELGLYSNLRNHFLATSRDLNESIVTSSASAVSILKSLEMEMEKRYDRLANAGVRNIEAYNVKYDEGKLKNNDEVTHRRMPFIIVIIDELADLMITAKRDIEDPIARIAQMARAVGIHLIVATQRPSVDVITGVIKANFPVRIAYQVASKIDSRTILDMGGADQLLRNGDMLYMSSSAPKPIRIQSAYITTDECEKMVEYIGRQKGFTKPYLLPSIFEKKSSGSIGDDEWDEMFEEAARLVVKLGICSTSTLQRRLKLGYARAARIVDQMEVAGIVGPTQGAKGREVLVSEDDLNNVFFTR
jgi:S-DNA-T family DNA segregation ATPase FtsK/SpoIIIE